MYEAQIRPPSLSARTGREFASDHDLRNRESYPRAPSGPKPPPSWTPKSLADGTSSSPRDDAEWRREAFDSRFFPSSVTAPPLEQGLPTLQDLCLKVIAMEDLPARWPKEFVASLPSYIRARMAEHAAIYAPLSSKTLITTYGQRDISNVVIVGRKQRRGGDRPKRGVRDEDFAAVCTVIVNTMTRLDGKSGDQEQEPENDWEDDLVDDEDDDNITDDSGEISSRKVPLLALAFISISLPCDILATTLPHTLTHLSLFGVFRWSHESRQPERHLEDAPDPELSYRALSRALPRLVALDLSENFIRRRAFMKVEWQARWVKLRVLGFRGCRWDTDDDIVSGTQDETQPSDDEMRSVPLWHQFISRDTASRINRRRPGRWVEAVVE